MDWSKGFKSFYYGTFVDPTTWRDTQKFEITKGSISRSDDELGGSADISTIGLDFGTEKWIRIWMDTRQKDSSEHVALFTGLATSPDQEVNNSYKEQSIECFSVLKPAADVLLDKGWYAMKGASGASIVKELLRVSSAPVIERSGSPVLEETIVAENGESNLSMINAILKSIGWRLKIIGNGSIEICPPERSVIRSFDPLTNDCIEGPLNIQLDRFNCPNVFRAISDDLYAIAKDDAENSELSITNRSREVWEEEDSVDLSDSEDISEYAIRMLKEKQKTQTIVSYARSYDPDIYIGDIIRLNYPEQGVEGCYQVASQNIDLDFAGITNEEVKLK